MRKHSKSNPRRCNSNQSARPANATSPTAPPAGFLQAWRSLLPRQLLPVLPVTCGARPRYSFDQLLASLVYHFFSQSGTLAEHFAGLFGLRPADSSLSQRRQGLAWSVFAEVLAAALGPRADPEAHPDSFFGRWRLVALDGTQFSLTNTPQINADLKKAKSRRGKAAFVKVSAAVLLEIGLRNPLAAAISICGQSEWALSSALLEKLPAGVLLLGDRLYGCAAFVVHALQACAAKDSRFLFRVRANIKAQKLKRLRDGSHLVRVPVRNRGGKITGHVDVREIRARLSRVGFRDCSLRLWTNLLNVAEARAQDLAELYARRWEHELYYRELKEVLRQGDVLQSHTPETARQEIAAIVLASSMVAAERVRVAQGGQPVLQVSYPKVLNMLRQLWPILELGADLLTEEQIRELVRRAYRQVAERPAPKRRTRSCPRAVRRPVNKWPRLIENRYSKDPVHIRITDEPIV